MARQDQYEQEYDDQAYEEVEEFYEDEGGDADSGVDYSEADVVRSMPWMAIAIAVHAIFLLIAMVIYTATIEEPKVEILKTELAEDFVMPIPEEQDPPEVEVPKPEDPVEDPTKDPKITEEAVDESNEDPTDNPNNQMAENPNADNTKAESPNPNSGPSSAFGTGGGGGGGGGMGGGGGAALRRARGGGGKENQKQVEAGLQWLADHQNEQTGSWSATNFMDSSIRTKKGAATTGILEFERVGEPGVGWANTVDVGLSGLALLAFVGDGHTHRGGKFKENVRRGLNYMLSVQDAEGCFGVRDGEEWIYNHAICAMAVIEIYIISQDRMLKSPAQRSVDFIVNAQNPGWGWRYDIKPGVNDSSVTAWMVLALKSAKMAELEFPAEQINVGANAWYDKVTVDEGYGPVTGYNSPGSLNGRLNESDHENNPSMDACNIMVRIYTHSKNPTDKDLKSQAGRINKAPAKWDHLQIDYYYWYYASLALFQMGGDVWKTWEKNLMNPVLLQYQRGWHPKDVEKFGKSVVDDSPDATRWKLDEHGSWDPVDAWGTAGGRVYATAINVLTLEVYYRYQKEYK